MLSINSPNKNLMKLHLLPDAKNTQSAKGLTIDNAAPESLFLRASLEITFLNPHLLRTCTSSTGVINDDHSYLTKQMLPLLLRAPYSPKEKQTQLGGTHSSCCEHTLFKKGEWELKDTQVLQLSIGTDFKTTTAYKVLGIKWISHKDNTRFFLILLVHDHNM